MANNGDVSQPSLTKSTGVQIALGTAVWGGVLAVSALANPTVMAFGLGLGVLVMAWGWAGALSLPTPRGTRAVLLLGGFVLIFSVWMREAEPFLMWVPAALAVSMIAALGHQLLRRDGRPRVLESVSGVVLGLAIITASVLTLPLTLTDAGAILVSAAVLAAGLCGTLDLLLRLRWNSPWLLPLNLLFGAGIGAGLGVVADADWSIVLLVGVLSAGVSLAMRSIMLELPSMTSARPQLVLIVTSVMIVGPLPYAVGRVLVPGALP